MMPSNGARPSTSSSSRKHRNAGNLLLESYLTYCQSKNLPPNAAIASGFTGPNSSYGIGQPSRRIASSMPTPRSSRPSTAIRGNRPCLVVSRISDSGSGKNPLGGGSPRAKNPALTLPVDINNKPLIGRHGVDVYLNADAVARDEEWESFFQVVRPGNGIDSLRLWSTFVDNKKAGTFEAPLYGI